MKEKGNKIKGAVLTIAPLLVAFGIQITVALIGQVIFFASMFIYDKKMGIEWYLDRATGQVVNLYSEQQYSLFLMLVSLISEIVMLIIAAIWYRHMKKQEKGFKYALNPIVVLLGLVLGVGIQGVTSLLLNFIYFVFPASWTASYDTLMETMLDSSSPVMIILVAIMAPLAEELFFRGVAINYGCRYFPPYVVLIIQAVCFGILHGNPVQFTYATIIGLVLGLVALEYKSVWPGVVVHIGVNASAEVLSLIGIEIPMLAMAAAGAFLCLLAVGGHILYKKRI